MNIRTRLILLVLSVLLPAFAAGGLAVWFVYDEQQEAQEKSLQEAARALALLVDKELQKTESMLKALGASPALSGGDLVAFYQHARQAAPDNGTSIILRDPNGKRLLDTSASFGDELPREPHDKPEIMASPQRADEDRTRISNLFHAPVGERYVFVVEIPVMVGNTVRYRLSRAVPATSLHKLLMQQGFPANWVAAVVDRQGVVVSRSDNANRFVGRHATGSLNDKILRGLSSGTNDGSTLDGKRVTAFFHRAPLSEWTVVLSVPVSELRRPAIHAALLLTGLILLIMIAALLVTRWYASRTIAPLYRLRQNAERLGRGEEVAPLASGVIEMDAIGTAISAASAQIRQSQVDLELRVAEAVAAAKRAQSALLQAQKLEALGRLTGGIAHDFNNVLQTLTTSLQLMRMDPDKERILSLAGACERALARATALIGQLRAFGRVQEASFETVDAAQAIEASLPLLQSALPSNIEFDTHLDTPLWPVSVDPVQFELALLNIVINARDAMPDGGRLTIDVYNAVLHEQRGMLPAGEYVRIAIADTGTGMAPDVLEKALDPFFTTKPVDKGTGLGLPQAYGFAVQAKGGLTLDSTEGLGTTVTIYLPRAAGTARVGTRSVANVALPSSAGTVLFVDDDELVLDIVGSALTRAGFSVMRARNGDEALSMLQSQQPVDVVFSDIVMPGETGGIELAAHIRRHFPEVGVVLATGYTEKQIDLPGVILLAKPYQAADAVATLQLAIAATHAL